MLVKIFMQFLMWNVFKVNTEADFKKSDVIKKFFPDLTKKLKFNEKGIALFAKITSDINEHNKRDAKKINSVFKNNFPMITYWLIAVNVIFICYSYFVWSV